MKNFCLIILSFLLISTQASAQDKVFCSVATAWKGALVYEWDTYRYTKSFNDCLCMAQEEVLGNEFESKIGKVRVMMLVSGSEEIIKKVFTISQLQKIKACNEN